MVLKQLVFRSNCFRGALSINNIAGGFDAGVTNLNLWLTATISGVFSFICISGFTYVGKRFLAEYLGKWATVIAGLLLILLGSIGCCKESRKQGSSISLEIQQGIAYIDVLFSILIRISFKKGDLYGTRKFDHKKKGHDHQPPKGAFIHKDVNEHTLEEEELPVNIEAYKNSLKTLKAPI